MISRIWHGGTNFENADSYEALLKAEILPGIHLVSGYLGTYVLRRDVDDGVECVTITMWDSMDAVKEFAGKDYEVAVVPPKQGRCFHHLIRLQSTTKRS